MSRLRKTVLLLVALAALILAGVYLERGDDAREATGNYTLLAVINLNLVLLCVLAFLIGRNVVKLVFDRKRRILGSALKLKLVFAFVTLTLIPTAILYVMASGLLTNAIEGWFGGQVEHAVEAALDVARVRFSELKSELRSEALEFRRRLEAIDDRLPPKELEALLEGERKARELFGIKIISQEGKILYDVHNAAALVDNLREPSPNGEAVQKALNSEITVLSKEKEGGQFIEAYSPLAMKADTVVLLMITRVSPELVQALAQVSNAYKEYQQLKFFKGEHRSGYHLMLALVTGSILFAAIWTGFYVARIIAIPIQKLAEGTRSIASGNYDVTIEAGGDDEIGSLVQSFNKMAQDIKSSREVAERRRLYLETVLANLAVGVIALDRDGRVSAINGAATSLLGFEDDLTGNLISPSLEGEMYAGLRELLMEVERLPIIQEKGANIIERELLLERAGRELKIICTAGRIVGADAQVLGSLVLLDDITELAKAQSMAVWKEVAQRIAHEIKNPLTPIQLSAQRLQKLLGGSGGDSNVSESVQSIVENVDSIKRLANEFSNFARMPAAEFSTANLNVLLADALAPYAESHSNIVFQFIGDNRMPDVRVDREQIRRVVINLIENAVDSISKDSDLPQQGRVTIKSAYDRSTKTASFEVSDNGPGIKPGERSRIFDPYFTTKQKGTGLGLAIVSSIVSEHQGNIRLYDNNPRGAKFIVELPISPRDT